MSIKVDPAHLPEEITKALEEYGELSTEVLKETVDEVSKEAATIIRDNAPVEKKGKRRGKYQRHIRPDTEYEDSHTKRNKVWASAHEYSLSHLLELGHDIVGRKGSKKGAVIGHAKTHPHFDQGAKYVADTLEKRLKNKLER